MNQNVGGLDKALRTAAGGILVGATFLDALPVWGYIGIVPLATGLLGFCPFYPFLGLNTCPVDKAD
jgi:hypothetical protein